ncbi:hypothetical protein H310_06661 [Aphanomyces invadans]|uniref:Uncharacterized protein n=1 Tax=Aphanomyces invadans TaxID=157072 RepID=A0A024U601_9STRA|nr:hypothetical protein H310_06661 [Aphanomyces invadans]ETW01028.1 hypothetical protein H310_06661 [Aphanomyces invadans]|eukprot:XP_008870026.1 hypothetical protein H310_06661 [Aphanomyces invadans]
MICLCWLTWWRGATNGVPVVCAGGGSQDSCLDIVQFFEQLQLSRLRKMPWKWLQTTTTWMLPTTFMAITRKDAVQATWMERRQTVAWQSFRFSIRIEADDNWIDLALSLTSRDGVGGSLASWLGPRRVVGHVPFVAGTAGGRLATICLEEAIDGAIASGPLAGVQRNRGFDEASVLRRRDGRLSRKVAMRRSCGGYPLYRPWGMVLAAKNEQWHVVK